MQLWPMLGQKDSEKRGITEVLISSRIWTAKTHAALEWKGKPAMNGPSFALDEVKSHKEVA